MSEREEEKPKVVVRDRRRIDPATGQVRTQDQPDLESEVDPANPAGSAADAPEPKKRGRHAAADDDDSDDRNDPLEQLTAEMQQVQADLAERTTDLQRITAEYANYRRRVERDKLAVVEQASGAVLTALLPILDDIDRAREHGDLTGGFKAVAEQLEGVLTKLGLAAFGDSGDAFDPMVHEAVMHSTSTDVTEPTCVEVLRRGYKLGDRLLRPALVAVADPGDGGGGPAAAAKAAPKKPKASPQKPAPSNRAGEDGGNGDEQKEE
ncbi:MAG: nucleotide exchange factor GrpE [Mycobacteriales bacterium]